MNNDAFILRELAQTYAEIANNPCNANKLRLHKASNDLKMIRPVVLIDEIPWHEMNFNGDLTLKCQDPYLREVECAMRRIIFQHNYFPADMIVKPYLSVPKIINSTGIGVTIREEVLETERQNVITSHDYEDQFEDDDSILKLHNAVISYDAESTQARYQLLGGILADIIPVKITGVNYFPVVTWDDIAMYRGVTPLLIDLMERPEFMHSLVSKLTDIRLDILCQYERLGLFENDPAELHCTPVATDDLPKAGENTALTRKNIWGRGAAQIFASVGKSMHEEYDIAYTKKIIGECGLAYYGCCEPLDQKIDIIEKIPNLRKVSITPWANINIAAEAIGNRFVVAAKPNPSTVAVGALDKEHLKVEIKTILDACVKNGCSLDLVLKDISTCSHRPENIFEWETVVMDLVKQY